MDSATAPAANVDRDSTASNDAHPTIKAPSTSRRRPSHRLPVVRPCTIFRFRSSWSCRRSDQRSTASKLLMVDSPSSDSDTCACTGDREMASNRLNSRLKCRKKFCTDRKTRKTGMNSATKGGVTCETTTTEPMTDSTMPEIACTDHGSCMSTPCTSDEHLFMMRPIGVASKKESGARNKAPISVSCTARDARIDARAMVIVLNISTMTTDSAIAA
mmetsp:Transcript_15750/g.49302  ORF Transcript_15750/g.49302 Transcript_15750/m.49302 type:complete len:216 (-) Transcript_15750:699-1346(-)